LYLTCLFFKDKAQQVHCLFPFSVYLCNWHIMWIAWERKGSLIRIFILLLFPFNIDQIFLNEWVYFKKTLIFEYVISVLLLQTEWIYSLSFLWQHSSVKKRSKSFRSSIYRLKHQIYHWKRLVRNSIETNQRRSFLNRNTESDIWFEHRIVLHETSQRADLAIDIFDLSQLFENKNFCH